MHVITKRRLLEFAKEHSDAKTPLLAWFITVKKSTYKHMAHLRETFPTADLVDELVVFNIGGNKYRLITAIHFNRKRVYIRHVLTHHDYDKGKWKEK